MPVLEMRTSERGALKRCVQQWYWTVVEGLTPIRVKNPLWFGSAVHEALADWYLPGLERGPHPSETFDRVLAGNRSMIVTTEEEEQEYVDARTLGIAMLDGYVARYGNDESWHVVATEQVFRANLPRPAQRIFGMEFPEVRNWLRYVGIWDGVFRDLETNEIWLMEHKTAASIRVDHLPLDDQAGSYWAFATLILRRMGVLGPKEEIAGIRYNFLRKQLPDQRPRNAEGMYMNSATSKEHMYNFFENELGTMDLSKKQLAVVRRVLPEEFTGKETMAQMKEWAEEIGVTPYGDPSKIQPAPLFERWPVYRSREERKRMIRRIQDEALFAAAYRAGELPITKTPDRQWCSWCPVKILCEADERGDFIAVEDLKQSLFTVRNPYAEHERKSAEDRA